MIERKNVPIQSLIYHIKTAVDVDPWAKEMAEELLKEQEVKMSVCDKCGLEHPADDRYCPRCGKSNFD